MEGLETSHPEKQNKKPKNWKRELEDWTSIQNLSNRSFKKKIWENQGRGSEKQYKYSSQNEKALFFWLKQFNKCQHEEWQTDIHNKYQFVWTWNIKQLGIFKSPVTFQKHPLPITKATYKRLED